MPKNVSASAVTGVFFQPSIVQGFVLLSSSEWPCTSENVV